MARIVLDTNCLIQSIPSKSPYGKVWKSFFDGTNQLCVTTAILEEYEEMLRLLTNEDIAMKTIHLIVGNMNTMFFTPYYHFDLIVSDPDDNKFVDCAVAANAKFLVTEDKHFNIVKQCKFPHVDIISLDDFLETL